MYICMSILKSIVDNSMCFQFCLGRQYVSVCVIFLSTYICMIVFKFRVLVAGYNSTITLLLLCYM